MVVCYSGDLAGADEAMAPIRALRDPVIDLLAEQPYTEVQSYLDATEPKGEHYYWKTGYLAESRRRAAPDPARARGHCPIPEAQLGLLHLGRALWRARRRRRRGGQPRRALRLRARSGCGSRARPARGEFRDWVGEAWSRVGPFTTGGNYVNFQTADEGEERIRASYGANFERLVEVKRRYDPDNLFRSNRNIRP